MISRRPLCGPLYSLSGSEYTNAKSAIYFFKFHWHKDSSARMQGPILLLLRTNSEYSQYWWQLTVENVAIWSNIGLQCGHNHYRFNDKWANVLYSDRVPWHTQRIIRLKCLWLQHKVQFSSKKKTFNYPQLSPHVRSKQRSISDQQENLDWPLT